jgi:hypothetical protein
MMNTKKSNMRGGISAREIARADAEKSRIVSTLIGSGFQLENVSSKPSHLVLRVYRTDEFGIRWRYVLAYSGTNKLSTPAVSGLRKVASNDGAALVIIGSTEVTPGEIPVLALDEFVGRMGGSIPSLDVLSKKW